MAERPPPSDSQEPQRWLTLSNEEIKALTPLKSKYQDYHHIFSKKELANLRFLKWRHQTGKLKGA